MRWGARVLLGTSFVMVIVTSCSNSPPPSTHPDIHTNAETFRSEGGVARFHLTNGTTYATNNYSVSDSLVVINVILRDSKYYGPTGEHLYDQPDVTPPPASVKPPVTILMSEIRTVERWEPRDVSHDSKKGWFIVGGVVTALVAALVIAIAESND